MNARRLLIYVANDTEQAFYEAVIRSIKQQNINPNTEYPSIIFKNISGILQNKIPTSFRKQVLLDNNSFLYEVILCYDSVAHEFAPKPTTDWKMVEQDLLCAGAHHVYHIKANSSIEDWFMHDHNGILRYLELPQGTVLPKGNGITKLCGLYKMVNNVYIKDSKLNGFVEQLNIHKIVAVINHELKPLINCMHDKE